jgi:hypothetical protein
MWIVVAAIWGVAIGWGLWLAWDIWHEKWRESCEGRSR